MSFGETKVYFDGSHYIGIPHTTRCVKKKPQPFEELITVNEENEEGSVEEVVTCDYNVFDMYNSQCCKPKFYDGHLDEDFDIQLSEPVEESLEGYIKYLEEVDDELPENYYQRRKTA